MIKKSLPVLERLIKEACAAPSNRFGPDFLVQHIYLHRAYALRLAAILGADPAVVEAAAFLHDVAAVRDFSCLASHPEESAKQAALILQDLGLAPDFVDRVCGCIAAHSAPVAIGAGSLEVVCVSNADAMSQLARPGYWFYYVFHVREMGCTEGMEWYRARLAAHKAGLIPQACELIAGEIERLEAVLNPA